MMSEGNGLIEEKLLSPSVLRKRVARFMAVQCLYMLALTGEEDFGKLIKDVVQSFSEETLEEFQVDRVDMELLSSIVHGARENFEVVDDAISRFLKQDWRIERLGSVIKALLRAGAYELLSNDKTPHPIIINEYLEIAKMLNHEGETGFVNSVLDNISKAYKFPLSKQP